MRIEEWENLVDGIFTAHGKNSMPSKKIMAKWYETVCEIPVEPAKTIARQIENSNKPEANLGAQFMALWFIWRAANPDKCEREERPKGCKFCDQGELFFVRTVQGVPYTCSCACGHCRPEVKSSITTYAAQEMGLKYIQPYRDENGFLYGQALATMDYVRQALSENYARG